VGFLRLRPRKIFLSACSRCDGFHRPCKCTCTRTTDGRTYHLLTERSTESATDAAVAADSVHPR